MSNPPPGVFILSEQGLVRRATEIPGHTGISAMSLDRGTLYLAKTVGQTQEIWANTLLLRLQSAMPVLSLCIKDGQVYFIHERSIKRITATGSAERYAGTGESSTAPIRSRQYAGLAAFGDPTHLVYDSTEQSIYVTDFAHDMIYSISQEGIIAPLFQGQTEYTSMFALNPKTSAEVGSVAGPRGLCVGADGALYATLGKQASMVIRLEKQFDATGEIMWEITTLLGLRQSPGPSGNGETAKYAQTNLPYHIHIAPNRDLYVYEEGTQQLKRISPEEYRVFSKGQSGALRYAPLQTIGNITMEGYVENLNVYKDAISTEFYSDSGATDEEGNVYFCDPKTGLVYRMDLNGKLKALNQSEPKEGLSLCVVFKNDSVIGVTTAGKWWSYSIQNRTFQAAVEGNTYRITALTTHPIGFILYATLENTLVATTTTQWFNGPSLPSRTEAMCVDDQNTLWIACQNRLYRCALTLGPSSISFGAVVEYAGNGEVDSWPFRNTLTAPIGRCRGIAFHPVDKCLYLATSRRICRISNGSLTTFIGSMNPGISIDGAFSTSSSIKEPTGLVADRQGNLYIFDQQVRSVNTINLNSTVLVKAPNKLFMRSNYVYALAGNGVSGYSGDGGPAQMASLRGPNSVAADANGNIYVADTENHVVRRIDFTTEQITLFAGVPGTNGQVVSANPLLCHLNIPSAVATSPSGAIYIANSGNHRVLRITKAAGGTTTLDFFAGNGTEGSLINTGTGVPVVSQAMAIDTPIGFISGIAVNKRNTVYLADSQFGAVYQVDMFNRMTLIGRFASGGPTAIVLDSDETGLYVAHQPDKAVYRILLRDFSISSYATGLTGPIGLACSPQGDLYVADGQRIKRIDVSRRVSDYFGRGREFTDGITPIAGVRDALYRMDALTAEPTGLAMNPYGHLLITETGSHRLRILPTTLAECGIRCASVKVDTGIAGRKPVFEFIHLYYGDFDPVAYKQRYPDLASMSDTQLRTHFLSKGSREGRDCLPRIELPADGILPVSIAAIRYIRVKGSSADCIGAKVYLYNDRQEIISLRVVSNTCLQVAGEVLSYSSPLEDCPFIPHQDVLSKECGVPKVKEVVFHIPEPFIYQRVGRGAYSAGEMSESVVTLIPGYPPTRLATIQDLSKALRIGAQWSPGGWVSSDQGLRQVWPTQLGQPTLNSSQLTSAPLTLYGYKPVDSSEFTLGEFFVPVANDTKRFRSLPIHKIFQKAIIVTKEDSKSFVVDFTEVTDTQSIKQFSFAQALGLQDAEREVLGVLLYKHPNAYSEDIEGAFIGLMGLTEVDGTITYGFQSKKVIRIANTENPNYEFIDFRASLKGAGCQSLESIYSKAFTYDLVRYVRISATPLEIAEVVVISAESGKNVALGRFGYTSAGRAIASITTGALLKVRHTSFVAQQGETWIEFDLGRSHILEQVLVYAPTDRTMNYTVKVYSEKRDELVLPGPETNPNSKAAKEVRFLNTGYMLESVIPGTNADAYLNIASVTAWPADSPSTNLATTATATASAQSIYNDNIAVYGPQNVFSGTSMYHSKGVSSAEYLSITFTTPKQLLAVNVKNRTDLMGVRTFGVKVNQYNTLGHLISSGELQGNEVGKPIEGPGWEIIPTMNGIRGVRYIRLRNSGGKSLILSQIAIYDHRAINISRESSVSSRSVATLSGVSTRSIVDGVLEPTESKRYQSQGTSTDEFIQLDLSTEMEITSIVIYGQDGGSNRLELLSAGNIPLRSAVCTNERIQEFRFTPAMLTNYSFPILSSRIGVEGVKKIRIFNETGNKKLMYSKLSVIDVNGVNRSPSIGYYESSSSSFDAIVHDLSEEVEVDFVEFYAYAPQFDSTGYAIQLLTKEGWVINSTHTTTGANRQVFDFRKEAFIKQSIRARYLRIEQAGYILARTSSPQPLTLVSCKVFDIAERNVCIAKVAFGENRDETGTLVQGIQNPLQDSPAGCQLSAWPGSYWEVDLGQEYSVYKIELKFDDSSVPLNTPVTLYSAERTPVKSMLLGPRVIDAPYTIKLSDYPIDYSSATILTTNTIIRYSVSNPRVGVPMRFIHIDGHANSWLDLRQVIAVDANGLNVAMGKSTYGSPGTPSFRAVNGHAMNSYDLGNQYFSSNGSHPYREPYWEVDLGGEYNICAIILLGARNVKEVRCNASNRGTFPDAVRSYVITSLDQEKHCITVDSAGPQEVFPRLDIGAVTRYVRLLKPFTGAEISNFLMFSQLVVVDTLGRNVAFGKEVTSRSSTIYPQVVEGTLQARSQGFQSPDWFYSPNGRTYRGFTWVDIDLGCDYRIADITLFANNNEEHWGRAYSNNVYIILHDSAQRWTSTQRMGNSADSWNIRLLAGVITSVPSCPVNTVKDGTQCRQRCIQGEEDIGGKCYRGCPSGQVINTTNRTTCLVCPDGHTDNGTQCIPACSSGYDPISGTQCRKSCSTDADGRPAGIRGGTNVCETLPFEKNLERISVSNSVWDIFSNNILYTSFVDDLTKLTTFFAGKFIQTNTFETEKNVGRARRIYTSAQDIQARGAEVAKQQVARPSREKTLVPPINFAVGGFSVPERYELVTATIDGIFTQRAYQVIYDWTSSTTFTREPTNPAYYKGRSFSETLHFAGSPFITVPSLDAVPLPEPSMCPAGYTANPGGNGSTACKLDKPVGMEEINGEYYSPCPSGTAPDSNTIEQCRTVCPNGLTARSLTQCISLCPAGFTEYEHNGVSKCARCVNSVDSNGNPVVFDPAVGTGRAKQQRLFNLQCYKQRYGGTDDHTILNEYHGKFYFEGRIPGCDDVCITDFPSDRTTDYEVYKVAYGWGSCDRDLFGNCYAWSRWEWRSYPLYDAWVPKGTNQHLVMRDRIGGIKRWIFAFVGLHETQTNWIDYTNQNIWEGDHDDDTTPNNPNEVANEARFRFLQKRGRGRKILTVPAQTSVRTTLPRTTVARNTITIDYQPRI